MGGPALLASGMPKGTDPLQGDHSLERLRGGRPRLGARWYPGKISIRITYCQCNSVCVHVQLLRRV